MWTWLATGKRPASGPPQVRCKHPVCGRKRTSSRCFPAPARPAAPDPGVAHIARIAGEAYASSPQPTSQVSQAVTADGGRSIDGQELPPLPGRAGKDVIPFSDLKLCQHAVAYLIEDVQVFAAKKIVTEWVKIVFPNKQRTYPYHCARQSSRAALLPAPDNWPESISHRCPSQMGRTGVSKTFPLLCYEPGALRTGH